MRHDLMIIPGLTESFYAMSQSRRFPNPLVSQLLDIAKIT